MDVHTLLCFCRQKRLTSKFRTFALRLGRRATEAKFSKAIANRKNQRRRQRQNPNGIAELNSTRARAPCSVLGALFLGNLHQRHSPREGRERASEIWRQNSRISGCWFQIPHHFTHSFDISLDALPQSDFVLFYFRSSIVYLLFVSICLQSAAVVESHGREAFSQVAKKLGSCNEERHAKFWLCNAEESNRVVRSQN